MDGHNRALCRTPFYLDPVASYAGPTPIHYSAIWQMQISRLLCQLRTVYDVFKCELQYSEASCHGPLARYVKLRVAHAPRMPGTFPPSLRVSDRDMHHGTCVTHVPQCMPGSLTSGFFWSRRWGETFPAFPVHAQEAHSLEMAWHGNAFLNRRKSNWIPKWCEVLLAWTNFWTNCQVSVTWDGITPMCRHYYDCGIYWPITALLSDVLQQFITRLNSHLLINPCQWSATVRFITMHQPKNACSDWLSCLILSNKHRPLWNLEQ